MLRAERRARARELLISTAPNLSGSGAVLQALNIGGVNKDQVSVIKLDCPALAWFGDPTVPNSDRVSGRIAEVFNDHA